MTSERLRVFPCGGRRQDIKGAAGAPRGKKNTKKTALRLCDDEGQKGPLPFVASDNCPSVQVNHHHRRRVSELQRRQKEKGETDGGKKKIREGLSLSLSLSLGIEKHSRYARLNSAEAQEKLWRQPESTTR